MRYLYACLMSLSLLAAVPTGAFAHALLEDAQPASGAVLKTAPATVQLQFSKPIEPTFSRVRVMNADGQRVDDDKPVVAAQGRKTIQVGLASLTPGTYKVVWRIVAQDGHHAQGEYSFTVK